MSLSLLDLARAYAPLLMIAIPFLGAAAAIASPWARLSWAFAALTAIAAALLAGDVAARVLLAGAPLPLAPGGLALATDGIGVFAAFNVAAAAALALIAAGGALDASAPRTAPLALGLAACIGAGWIGALLARDFTGLIAGAAIAWLAGLALVALRGERDRTALNGALRMLGAGGVAGALMLLGAGLIARGAGSLELAALESSRIAAPGLAAAGAAFLLAGCAIKAGIAPLHLWVGAAYGRAGALAGMMIGAVSAIGALALLVRVAAHALGAPALGAGVAIGLAGLGLASVAIGSVQAIGAHTLARLAGYAAVAQGGCVVMSAALGSQVGLAAALVQLTALAAAALALLGGAAAAQVRTLSALDGLARRAPLASVAIAAGALGLMGAPLTIGFLGRWRMIEASVGVDWWWAACAAIAASLAGVFYGGRLIERIYFRRASAAGAETGARGFRFAFAPMLIAAVLITAIGFEPSLLLRAAGAAAGLTIGAAP